MRDLCLVPYRTGYPATVRSLVLVLRTMHHLIRFWHRGNERALLEGTAEFTVLIKNFIEFPKFGNSFRRRNIMEEANKTYLQSCTYNAERDPYCPVFKIRDLVELAGENFTRLAIRGGVIVISVDWNW